MTPQQLRHHIADVLATLDSEWTADIAAHPVKAWDWKRVLKDSPVGHYTRTAHSGVLANGEFAVSLAAPIAGLPDYPADARDLSGFCREYFTRPCVESPARPVGAQKDGEYVAWLLEDDDGNRAVIRAVYLATLRRFRPGAELHVSLIRGKPDHDAVLIAIAAGERVGCVVPLTCHDIRKIAPRPVGSPSAVETLFASLEPGPDTEVIVSKDTTRGGRKHFTVRANGAAVDVCEVTSGRFLIRDTGTCSQLFASGLCRRDAKAIATRLVLHAHGRDHLNGGTLFRRKP